MTGETMRGHREGWLGRLQRAVVLVLATGLVLSCSTDESSGDDPSTSPRPATSAPSEPLVTSRPGATETPQALPQRPPDAGPRAFATLLDRALTVVRTGEGSVAELRRAAEYHQLAVRELAMRPDPFRRRALARLHEESAQIVRREVDAATLLRAMTDPQRTLPRWRIVEPPSAPVLRGHYRVAERRTGVPWQYLAAIHLVETRMGRIRGTSTAGAKGPMQFIPPTWDRYGAGGDIEDPRDSILAAARLLRANGAPGDMSTALWHYNPSTSYVAAVTDYARSMQAAGWLYRSYWHWRVLYRHVRGTYALPVGYPKVRPERVGPG